LSLPSSTRPGFVRQASCVGVEPGKEVRVASGLREAVDGKDVRVGVGWLEGEQACNTVRSVSSNEISFVASRAFILRIILTDLT